MNDDDLNLRDLDEEEDEEEQGPPPYARRLLLFKLVALLAVALVVRQLWMLQVVEGAQFRQYADENRLRQTWVKPARGVMYDRDGTLLVRNIPSYTAAIVPAALPQDEAKVVYRRLGSLLTMTAAEVQAAFDKGRVKVGEFTPVPIKARISTEAAFAIEEDHLNLPGVMVVIDPTRDYLEGPLGSHLIGYIGRISEGQYEELKDDSQRRYEPNDQIGQTGLEAIYENELRGKPGEKLFEVDSTEREVGVVRSAEAQPGNNLVLTIDWDLQRAVTELLAKNIKEWGAAAAVVLDPNNGQVLALVDLPSYDNNLFARGISDRELETLFNMPHYPLINKAVSSAFPPGSTFKIITAAGALQAGVVNPNTIVSCPGGMFIPSSYGGGAWLKCWGGHDTEDLIAGMADSCDTYFYQLAGGEPHDRWPGLGPDRLSDYARAFGLGQLTGIDLEGEVAGLVPDPKWKLENLNEQWYRGDTYIMGIGQGFLQVTPLQMAQALTPFANGGTIFRPQLVKEIRDDEGRVVRAFQPQVLREVPVEKQHLLDVREGLRANLTYGKTKNGAEYWGTAWDSEIKGLEMAGKTGTAESILNEKGEYLSHGWFTAFAPYKNPEISVLVFVQNGKGPQHAAHLVSDIMRYYFKVPEEKKP
ncbi:MAG: penicillin-binding protein 2 [Chloroflexota bacterium]